MLRESRIPIKYTFGIIKYELTIVLLLGLATHLGAFELMNTLPVMPLAIPAFLGTSISVLLSFKMNQSYDRWWEARRIWGSILNDSRSLIIQLQSFIGVPKTPIIKLIGYRQIAWGYVLGRSLRRQNALQYIAHLLPLPELTAAATQNNQPLFLLQNTARDLEKLRQRDTIDVHAHIHLQETIIRLTDSMGGVERINNTVFPSTYRLVLHFIIYLFVVTLAISLKDIDNRLVIPLLLLISAGFFLIEKVAYYLQDPFRNRPSDVAITEIAKTIEKDIRQLLGEEATATEPDTRTYYIM
ncbi:bestrophin family protein [Pseudobacter ginsenosidimutans]|uniref:Putative membrane protein n=1 Tax=Pseudobacter ginsenosidimutans TaxID=661488 RepID=A0A4Q7N1L3_9BACT|nr:bestrophin family ion channel [Pseudobacter ginsenosidimutans]QEC43152.1 hypothetical protein FSB84_16155 [Pseudobacter ginsenosidimutans]RZS74509.1 putative membrane protein [Pseudobacter ginsenosidimutans]